MQDEEGDRKGSSRVYTSSSQDAKTEIPDDVVSEVFSLCRERRSISPL